jgi:hypothetical protein
LLTVYLGGRAGTASSQAGAAAKAGAVEGERIIAINGVSVAGKPYEEVVATLIATRGSVELEVFDPTNPFASVATEETATRTEATASPTEISVARTKATAAAPTNVAPIDEATTTANEAATTSNVATPTAAATADAAATAAVPTTTAELDPKNPFFSPEKRGDANNHPTVGGNHPTVEGNAAVALAPAKTLSDDGNNGSSCSGGGGDSDSDDDPLPAPPSHTDAAGAAASSSAITPATHTTVAASREESSSGPLPQPPSVVCPGGCGAAVEPSVQKFCMGCGEPLGKLVANAKGGGGGGSGGAGTGGGSIGLLCAPSREWAELFGRYTAVDPQPGDLPSGWIKALDEDGDACFVDTTKEPPLETYIDPRGGSTIVPRPAFIEMGRSDGGVDGGSANYFDVAPACGSGAAAGSGQGHPGPWTVKPLVDGVFKSLDYKLVKPAAIPPWGRGHPEPNRYRDILPTESTRFKLKKLGSEVKTTYINANHVTGEAEWGARFIAAQGPTKGSVPSFVRMVWESNSRCIVMTTNLIEMGKVKCERYWSVNSVVLLFSCLAV